MKKIIFTALLFLSGQTMADGIYDGIWHLANVGYFSVHQNGNIIIAIRIRINQENPELAGEFWDAFQGEISGNVAELGSLVGNTNSTFTVTFTSENSVTLVQNSCEHKLPENECLLPNGVPLDGSKFW